MEMESGLVRVCGGMSESVHLLVYVTLPLFKIAARVNGEIAIKYG
jgi:hypothetical protein